MNKRKVNAVIEKSADGGYGIYCPELEGISLFGYGLTEKEAKEDLENNFEAFLEHYEEENLPIPVALSNGNITFDYSYDFSGFFKSYPVFNVSELAKTIGVNSSLLRRYKQGLAFASNEQKKRIEQGIHELGNKLSTVKF